MLSSHEQEALTDWPTKTLLDSAPAAPESATSFLFDPESPTAIGHATHLPVPSSPPSIDRSQFDPVHAAYYDAIMREFALDENELAVLRRNGFVISDRLTFQDFQTAYAYLHWKDLPVLITTDALLHAVHQTYDDLLLRLESSILQDHLRTVLHGTHRAVQQAAQTCVDPDLAALYSDLDVYLQVPLALLDGTSGQSRPGQQPAMPLTMSYLERVLAADSFAPVTLFAGKPRPVDFTLFKPRGHYAGKYIDLSRYFRAMIWLAQIDFRFVDYDPHGALIFQPTHLAAAVLLRDALEAAGVRSAWEEFDALFRTFIGRSDNITLHELDRFLATSGLEGAREVLDYPDPDALRDLLLANPDGQQRITGQLLTVWPGLQTPIPRPVSFMLVGQRFSLESYIMSQLVYDRLRIDDRKVARAFPQVLDVWHALGSDRAATHLEPELTRYGYAGALQHLRELADHLPSSFWTSSIYNRFLQAVRTLQQPIDEPACPPALRTAVWADKMLHTTLAAWAQARHDNILYLKQSVTAIPVCEYPAGYVEPYPAFYAAVEDYARESDRLFAALQPHWLTGDGQRLVTRAREYFAHLVQVAGRLEQMAEKALQDAPWSEDDVAFLRDTAVRTAQWYDPVCAGIREVEHWQGWYPRLLPWGDDTPAVIADVHTNPSDDPMLQPPGVLHAGSGGVATIVLLAGDPGEETLYCGPGLTYYEFIEPGLPPQRLTDDVWRARLRAQSQPAPPLWTAEFRVPSPAVEPRAFPRGQRPERHHRVAAQRDWPIRVFHPGTRSEDEPATVAATGHAGSWLPEGASPGLNQALRPETRPPRVPVPDLRPGTRHSGSNALGRPPRVLVVNDSAAVRRMVATTLQHGGFAVAQRTLDELASSDSELDMPDVLLLDWALGHEGEGLDQLQQVRFWPATAPLPVVVCAPPTAVVADLAERVRDRAVVVLQKPVSAQELWAALWQAMEEGRR